MCEHNAKEKRHEHILGEATVAAHQSGKTFKAICKLFGVHHSIMRKIILNKKGGLTSEIP